MICATHTAQTPVYGVIGDPVGHSFSPVIQQAIAKAAGDDFLYTAFHVKPENVRDAIKGAYALNIQGLNITIPHKQSVMAHLAHTDASALEAGAVNTLKYMPDGYHGCNTDIAGIAYTLRAYDVSASGAVCIVLGGGGSARAALAALARGGAKRIYLINRTAEKAHDLAERMQTLYTAEIVVVPLDDIGRIDFADVLIQTTSAGFGTQSHLSPIAGAQFCRRVGTVFDIIYTPWETKLLQEARSCGALCINGFDMLVYQAVAAYEIWHGKQFSSEFVTGVLAELKAYYMVAIEGLHQ